MLEYPERKKYVYSIYTTKWELVIRFMQATASESKDYFKLIKDLYDDDVLVQYKTTKEISKYFVDFIKKSCEVKWYQYKKKSQIRYIIKHIDVIQEQLSWKLHIIRDSMYNGSQMPIVEGEKPRPVLFENILEYIYSKTWILVDKINDILTFEQIWYYTDKSIFSSYETFKEWRAINDRLKIGKNKGLSKQDEEDLAFIKSQKNGSWN